MNSSQEPHSWRSNWFDLRSGEVRTFAWAAAWFFCVLASYYVIRPIREVYGVSFSPSELTRSFATTLAAMVVAAPLYAALVAMVPRRALAPVLYSFFALNLIAFRLAIGGIAGEPPLWLRWTFFVWLSVFNLYVVTLFWSNAVELFTGEQGKRLFGLIAAAGTLGGIAGSQVFKLLASSSRPQDSLLISAALLMAALACSVGLRRAATPGAGPPSAPTSWQTIWGGAADLLRSPYLAGIGLWIVMASICATGVYLQMLDLVKEQIADNAERGAWFADLNTYQNLLTLFGQAIGAGWLMRTVGVGAALAAGSLVYLSGFTLIGLGYASLPLLGTFDVAQRFAGFAFGVPGREVLFTAVAPAEKYRAKAFADTVLQRAGGSGAAYCYQVWITAGHAVSSAAWIILPLAMAMTGLSFGLGAAFQRRSASTQDKLAR